MSVIEKNAKRNSIKAILSDISDILDSFERFGFRGRRCLLRISLDSLSFVGTSSFSWFDISLQNLLHRTAPSRLLQTAAGAPLSLFFSLFLSLGFAPLASFGMSK